MDDVKVNTHNINNRVSLLDGKMAEVRDGMNNVQQGIMLLCHTVAEVTNRVGLHNTRSSQALKGFLTLSPGGSSGQYSLPSMPGSSSSSAAAGLNLLLGGLDSAATSAAIADVDITVYAESAPEQSAPRRRIASDAHAASAAAYVVPEVSRGVGGPPSFPGTTTPSSSAATVGNLFWGMGRK